MVRIQHAQYEGGYKVRLRFDTGEVGVTDLGDVIAKYTAARQLLDQSVIMFIVKNFDNLHKICYSFES